MNEDTISDFKQFMTATISQQTADIREDLIKLDKKIDEKIENLDKKLSEKIDNLSVYVAEAIDNSNSAVEDRLNNHEVRITKLETKTA